MADHHRSEPRTWTDEQLLLTAEEATPTQRTRSASRAPLQVPVRTQRESATVTSVARGPIKIAA